MRLARSRTRPGYKHAMRSSTLVALALAAPAAAQKPDSVATPGLTWHADFAAARAAAEQDGKPVALYFTFET